MTRPGRTLDLSRCTVALVANARAGAEDTDDLVAMIRQRIEPAVRALKVHRVRHGRDVAGVVRGAVAQGADVVAALGGDGTQSAVAGALAGSDTVMAVLPGGTFNYFARELGVETLEAALDALAGGVVAGRDLGAINGRAFINNASFGLYPHILEHREAIYRSWGRSRIATYCSILLALRDMNDPMHLAVTVDGALHRFHSPLAFVARSAFQLENLGLEGAEAVRGGRFALFVARGKSPGALAAASWRLARGRTVRGEDFDLVIADEMEVETGAARRLVALDGEKERMSAPFHLKVLRDALQVIVPAAQGPGDTAPA